MVPKIRAQRLAWFALVLVFVFAAAELEARRGGGGRGGRGGGFSRSSPARGGSFRGGRSGGGRNISRNSPARGGSVQGRRAYGGSPQASRRGGRSGRRHDERRDVRSERREVRHDVRSEIREFNEWHEDRWRFRVGMSLTMAAFRALSCASSAIVVDGVTYYHCGPTWYSRAYTDGNVTYVVVNPPADAGTTVIITR